MKLSKKGYTLVEVMATLAVSTIVIVAVLLAIQSFSGQYASGSKRLQAKNAATLAAEYLENAIFLSRRAYIDNSVNALGYNVITSRDGRLYKTLLGYAEAELMDGKNYNGLYCRADFFRYDKSTVRVQLAMFESEASVSPLYTLLRDIRLINTFDENRDFGAATDIVLIEPALTQGAFLKYIQ